MQWNINGFRSKYLELCNLITEYNPKVIALQETKVEVDVPIKIKNYNVYRKDRTRHGGGVCIAVHNSIPSHQLEINTDLEIICCKIMLKDLNLTICNIYFNDGAIINTEKLDELNKLPPPLLIIGDINGKHPTWGSQTSDNRGILINDWTLTNNKFILNDGSPTRYDINHNTYSHIDISVIDNSQCDKFAWRTIPNRLISDHFPILLEYGYEELYTTKLQRWIIEKAKWKEYRKKVNIPENAIKAENPCLIITKALLDSANTNIPKSSSTINTKYSNCWWNEDCKIAVQNANKQFTKLKRNSTPENVEIYNNLEETVQTTLIEARKISWNSYTSSITRKTSHKEIWNKINAISGKRNNQTKIILEINNNRIGEPTILVEVFGQSFSFISSNANYSPEFNIIKNRDENTEILFHPKNTWYNKPLTIAEFEIVLSMCTRSSPGPDDLHYSMFKELTTKQKKQILNFFNHLWINNIFPESWRTAIVIPILKPRKPPHISTSYRPISLTSCFCKIMEKIVNRRLSMYLDKNNVIQPYQSGSRKFHSTYDSLVRFESAIRENLLKSEYLVAVYFDIEKAFDMVWVHGLLRILKEIGLEGHLPNFIKNFLKYRKIKVRLGDILSSEYLLDNGVPQGSILSPILFILVINSMFKNTPDINKSLFFDDGLAWTTGADLESAMNKMQSALDVISEWGPKLGIKFSTSKTQYMIFTKRPIILQRNEEPEIKLTFYGESLEKVAKYKYLGLIFDPTLTWKRHIDKLVEKCKKPLSILQCVANKNWGADRKSLINLYLAIIQSKINYGDFIYGSAAKCHLTNLNRIQHRALRIISGSLKCTPGYSLESETNILPLEYKRALNGLKYMGRVYRLETHPTKKCFEEFLYFQHYREVRKTFPIPVVGRIKNFANKLKLPISKLEKIDMKYVNTSTQIIFPFTMKGSDKNDPTKCRQDFLFMKNTTYRGYLEIYTDGSKINNRTGCAYVVNGIAYKTRLTRYSSVFSAELYAILKSLQYIKNNINNKFIIFSDSLSSIESIKNNKNKSALNIKISQILNKIKNKTIAFEWIPSHIDIEGNETADQAAKDATNERNLFRLPLNINEYNAIVKKKIHNLWQKAWHKDWKGRPCPLYKIKPKLGDWKSSYKDKRKNEVVICRMRTGWCRYLVQHHFKNPNLPAMNKCTSCGVTNTLEHLILICPRWSAYRGAMYSHLVRLKLPMTLSSILGDYFNHDLLFEYLRAIKFFDHI